MGDPARDDLVAKEPAVEITSAADSARDDPVAKEPAVEITSAADLARDHPVAKEAVSERDESVHTVEAKRELLQGVKDIEVLQELAEIADSAALEELVQRGKPPKWKKKASISKPASGEMTFEAPPRRDSASQNVSSQFGSVSRSQI